MAVTTTAIPRWRAADRKGVAHAFADRAALKTACGAPAWAERYDWPRKSKCLACQVALGEVSELEARALGGDR